MSSLLIRMDRPLLAIYASLLAMAFFGASCATQPETSQTRILVPPAGLEQRKQAERTGVYGELVCRPDDGVLQTMSYSQAKKKILSMENLRKPPFPGLLPSWVRNIKITSDKLTWDWVCPQSKFWPSSANTSYFQAMNISVHTATHEGQRAYRVHLGDVTEEKTGVSKKVTEEGDKYFWETPDKDEAVALASAFYVLKRHAQGYKEDDGKFVEQARTYREMPVKPPLPEDAKRFAVMAEDALNNKEFEKALDYYLKGLATDPLWPTGQFNAAILAGELHIYDLAASHMRRYLELCPEAPDAKAARDKLYLWEGKDREEQQ